MTDDKVFISRNYKARFSAAGKAKIDCEDALVKNGFKNIGQFDIKIKDYFLNKNSSVALKEYCLKVIKESFYFLNNNLYIEFEKCPIQSDYENLLFKLENSISSKDIESALLVFSDSKMV